MDFEFLLSMATLGHGTKETVPDIEFGDLKDSLIRDRIVGGVLLGELRGQLLRKARSYSVECL